MAIMFSPFMEDRIFSYVLCSLIITVHRNWFWNLCIGELIMTTKVIQFRGNEYRVLLQDKNGPCGIIAICNVLILSNAFNLERDCGCTKEVRQGQLISYLVKRLNDEVAFPKSVIEGFMNGIDVNLQFTGIQDLVDGKEAEIFRGLGINFYHGFVASPEVLEVIKDDRDPSKLNNFISSNPSKMTDYGLSCLRKSIEDDEISVLYKSDHFYAMVKCKEELFLLITDEGYKYLPMTWELLQEANREPCLVNNLENYESSWKSPPVGIAYDDEMLQHDPGDLPIENCTRYEVPNRILWIQKLLSAKGIFERCKLVKLATGEAYRSYEENLRVIHKDHVDFIRKKAALEADTDNSIYYCAGTFRAALSASAHLEELCRGVMEDKFKSGFAIIRPPGHHSSPEPPRSTKTESRGYCVFNNVAEAIQMMKAKYSVRRIVVLDWDAHHGDGTQTIFNADCTVLVISIHGLGRDFYPYTGESTEVGEGAGKGFNINIPLYVDVTDEFPSGLYGNSDYLKIWKELVVPVIKSFDPEIIVVSAGFDATKGDIGGFAVTPDCWGVLLEQILPFADGRVVLALEGGYRARTRPRCVLSCVRALLGDPPAKIPLGDLNPRTDAIIEEVRSIQQDYWPCFRKMEKPNKKVAKLTSAGSMKITTRLFREIGKYQRSTQLLIDKEPFRRIAKEIAGKIAKDRNLPIRLGYTCMLALQEAAEANIVRLFEDSYICTTNAKRVTLMKRDMDAAQRIRGDL